MNTVTLDGHSLTIADVVHIARDFYTVEIHPDAVPRVLRSSALIQEKVRNHEVIYAVTTGFGANADKVITDLEDAKLLQKNLLRSHACGVGAPFTREIVRAIMCIRLNTLLSGHSGIQMSTVELLRDLINKKIHPIIPSQGSVGSSGDLCPLSHMSLPLIGEGLVEYQKVVMPAADALRKENLQPIDLIYKEGIALNNGTTVMTALGCFATHDMDRLMKLATLTAALSCEALCARPSAFDARIHEVRRHAGQIEIARLMREYTEGSTFIGVDPKRIPGKKNIPQDAYSIRCIPQVYGASLAALRHAQDIISHELNAVVDNPIIFPEDNEVLSGGNFHGQPIALVLDYLKLALSEVGDMSERRSNKLLDPATNDGLPAFLTEHSGLHSGMMILQYVAASLVSEDKVLVHPASADSIPTSANTEDHVSMGTIAGRQALEILGNVKKIIVIEMIIGAQALDMRMKQFKGRLADKTRGLYEVIRSRSAYLDADRQQSTEINQMVEFWDALLDDIGL